MKEQLYFVASLLALVLTVNGLSGRHENARTGESESAAPNTSPDLVPVSEVHMNVHIDPKTRQFTDSPAFSEPHSPAIFADDAMNFSSEGLEERASEVAGGGIVVDLRGRFRNTSVATINDDGTVTAPCLAVGAESVGEHRDEEVVESGDKR